jgi:hypothetical protein
VSEVREPLVSEESTTPGVAFAQAVGATLVLSELVSGLDLGGLEDARLGALEQEAAAHATGYSLRQWTGRTPDELAEDQALLKVRLSTDVPWDDLEWEAEVWDVARLRELERTIDEQQRLRIVTAAHDNASGHLVAYTDLGVSKLAPQTAYQWDTIVMREHRGHRLGLLVKAANLRFVRRLVPEVTRVITWNAESNEHMLAINQVMGFVPEVRNAEWELAL